LEEIRFHDLRHTAASLLLYNGIPVLVVSKILGHANASTVLDIFGHLISVKQEEAASTMDELTAPIAIRMNQIVSKQSNVK
jgi:integrase